VIINGKVQKWMGGRENDGLVEESSVSVLLKDSNYVGQYEHVKGYPNFREINHTYLIANAQVAIEIVKWIRSLESPSVAQEAADVQRADG
jgi:hypothetical protein